MEDRLRLHAARVIFSGKGGVGKSTLSFASALASAKSGTKTCLFELGSRPTYPDVFKKKASFTPQRLSSEYPLFGSWISFRPALALYLQEHLKIKRLVRVATETGVLSRLWEAAPSVREFCLLNAIFILAQKDGFERVVIDFPASGHAVSLFGVPKGIEAMIRGGPIVRRAQELQGYYFDASRSQTIIAALPETLPITETLELYEKLNALGVPNVSIAVNQNRSQALRREALAILESDEVSNASAENQALASAARYHAERVSAQGEALARLEASKVPTVVLPWLPDDATAVVERLSALVEC